MPLLESAGTLFYWFLEYLVHPQSHFMDLPNAVIESSCLHSVCCCHLPATHHESWAGNNFLIPLKSSEIPKKKRKKRKNIFRLFPRRGKKPPVFTPKIACSYDHHFWCGDSDSKLQAGYLHETFVFLNKCFETIISWWRIFNIPNSWLFLWTRATICT